MAVYTQAHDARPRSVSLILASQEQAFDLRQLLLSLSVNFDGCLLIHFSAQGNARRQMQIQIQQLTKFRTLIAAKSVSLSAGQIIWLDPDKTYEINGSEQVCEVARSADVGLIRLINSLGQRFASRASLVPMVVKDQTPLLKAANEFGLHRGQILLPKELERTAPDFAVLLQYTTQATVYLDPWQLAEALRQQLAHPHSAATKKPLVQREIFERILDLLTHFNQANFNHYREPALITRLEQRLERIGETNLGSYYQRLQSDREELTQLYQELLIGTTSFFRQPEAYDDLYKALSSYIERGAEGLKIWSAGCSTGEEAYSIALLTDRLAREIKRPIKVTIYATDLDRRAVEKARKGLYTRKALEEIPKEYYPNKVERVGTLYDVGSAVKSSILFSHHDILSFRPLKELDLIVCRNLLIYFKPDTQDALIGQFHGMLKPGGLLMLGRSESTGTSRARFVPIAHSSRIYKALSFEPLAGY